MTRASWGKPHFREDINGLRAWAVMAVIFYHFGVPGFSAGFAGVDVFFVISGFLMKGIVVAELQTTGGFRVWNFYVARARRIVPALVVLVPEMNVNVPQAMARTMVLGTESDISLSLSEYHKRQDFIWAAQDAARVQCGAKILDPLPYLCSDGECKAVKDGRPLYYDASHLSEFGNRMLIPMFADVFAARSPPVH